MRGQIGIVACALVALLAAAPAFGGEVGDAKKAAKRASHLAAKGKCKQAVTQYNKAIPVLHDPTLFFNRGECHRHLGNVEAALADYNQFLTELPDAPNRAEVESRIAELTKPEAPPAVDTGSATGAPPRSPAAAAPKPVIAASPPKAAGPGASKPTASKPPSPPAPSTAASQSDEPTVAALNAPPPVSTASPDGEPPSLLAPLAAAPSEPRAPPDGEARHASSSRPWFWIAVGAAVVGAGTAAYLVLSRDPTQVPASPLGNYRF